MNLDTSIRYWAQPEWAPYTFRRQLHQQRRLIAWCYRQRNDSNDHRPDLLDQGGGRLVQVINRIG